MPGVLAHGAERNTYGSECKDVGGGFKFVCKCLTRYSYHPKVKSNSLPLDHEPVFEVRSDLLLIIIIIAKTLCGFRVSVIKDDAAFNLSLFQFLVHASLPLEARHHAMRKLISSI